VLHYNFYFVGGSVKKLAFGALIMWLSMFKAYASSGWVAEAKLYDKVGKEKMSTQWLFGPRKTREECDRELVKRLAAAEKRSERLFAFCTKV
jgi:hypothetical protein